MNAPLVVVKRALIERALRWMARGAVEGAYKDCCAPKSADRVMASLQEVSQAKGFSGNLAKGNTIYVRSMGKALRVTGMFLNYDQANEWMPKNEGHGVVACWGPIIVCADLTDRGIDLPSNQA